MFTAMGNLAKIASEFSIVATMYELQRKRTISHQNLEIYKIRIGCPSEWFYEDDRGHNLLLPLAKNGTRHR